MRYLLALTIPANTPATAPVEDTLAVAHGTLIQAVIQIPPGSAGLAGVRILRYRDPIVPATPQAWITGDGDVFPIPESRPIHEAPYELIVQGYNLDDLYEHTITVHVDVMPEDPAGPQAQMGLLKKISGLLGL